MKRWKAVFLILALVFGISVVMFWAIQVRRSVPLVNGYRLYCDVLC